MHPGSSSTTPFSVEDILKLGQHHDFESEFLMSEQVVPMHYQQHVHGASRSEDVYECQPEPRDSGMQEKLEPHISAAGELDEQGEMIRT